MDHHYHAHEQHPGYYYNWVAPLQQWLLKWEPVADAYSPPVLDHSAQWAHLTPPQGVNAAPLNCQKIAQETGATYVYYRQDLGKLEIWAHDITEATTKTAIYLQGIRQRQQKPDPKLRPTLR